MVDEKKKKAAIKEGGKKGVDLVGVSDMGGVSFFNISVEVPEGDMELLEYVMEGANAAVDEGAEERKGGASGIGKLFFSAGTDQLALYCHVPKELSASKGVTMQSWIEAVNAVLKGEITHQDEEYTKIIVKKEPERFPLKLRDEGIAAGLGWLKTNNLIPADDSSDDDVNYAEAAGVEW